MGWGRAEAMSQKSLLLLPSTSSRSSPIFSPLEPYKKDDPSFPLGIHSPPPLFFSPSHHIRDRTVRYSKAAAAAAMWVPPRVFLFFYYFFCRQEFSFVALFLLSLYECGCMWCIPPALPSFPFPRHCPPADAFRAAVLLSFPQWMWRGGEKKPSSPPSFLPIHRSIRPILFGRKTDCGARKVMQCLPSPLADVRNSDVQSSASEDELEFTQKSWTDKGHFRVLFHDKIVFLSVEASCFVMAFPD